MCPRTVHPICPSAHRARRLTDGAAGGMMRLMDRLAAVVPVIGLFAACGTASDAVVLRGGDRVLTLHPDEGTFDLARGDRLVIERATADVLYSDGNGQHLVTMQHCVATSDLEVVPTLV